MMKRHTICIIGVLLFMLAGCSNEKQTTEEINIADRIWMVNNNDGEKMYTFLSSKDGKRYNFSSQKDEALIQFTKPNVGKNTKWETSLYYNRFEINGDTLRLTNAENNDPTDIRIYHTNKNNATLEYITGFHKGEQMIWDAVNIDTTASRSMK